jgi:hypothetical protein
MLRSDRFNETNRGERESSVLVSVHEQLPSAQFKWCDQIGFYASRIRRKRQEYEYLEYQSAEEARTLRASSVLWNNPTFPGFSRGYGPSDQLSPNDSPTSRNTASSHEIKRRPSRKDAQHCCGWPGANGKREVAATDDPIDSPPSLEPCRKQEKKKREEKEKKKRRKREEKEKKKRRPPPSPLLSPLARHDECLTQLPPQERESVDVDRPSFRSVSRLLIAY